MQNFVLVLESIGLFAVGLSFIFLMPSIGEFLAVLFSAIMGERLYAKLKGIPSGSDMGL